MNPIVAPENAAIRFAGAMNYRIEGDIVHLEADLQVCDAARAATGDWRLQFWSEDGANSMRIAELPLGGVSAAQGAVLPVGGSALAALPAGNRSHRVALRVVCASPAGDEQHDAAVFAHPQHFRLPCLGGAVGYRFDADRVELRVDAVENPREADNCSGTLALELWALPFAYQGGAFEGAPVAGIQIGRLQGQCAMNGLEFTVPAASLPPGEWHLTLMLREWTAGGFVTRDFSRFAQTYTVAAPEPAPAAAAAPAPQPAVSASAPSPKAAGDAARAAPKDRRISVNRASMAELAAVKGVSKALAAAIVAARPYGAFDELTRVRGIGEKLLGKLRAALTL